MADQQGRGFGHIKRPPPAPRRMAGDKFDPQEYERMKSYKTTQYFSTPQGRESWNAMDSGSQANYSMRNFSDVPAGENSPCGKYGTFLRSFGKCANVDGDKESGYDLSLFDVGMGKELFGDGGYGGGGNAARGISSWNGGY